jgi:predicted DsbA family dithiol-disulfide isomerase
MQVFFDYECPFCKKGYEYLVSLIGDHPEIDIEWRPIESHPLPEDHPPHTYLAVQAYYAAKELDADMPAFFAALFQAAAIERQDVEKIDVLCNVVKNIVDPAGLRAILESGKYKAQLDENNDLAYEKSGVWFVPAFRMFMDDGSIKKLDAEGGVGVSREGLRDFLSGAVS